MGGVGEVRVRVRVRGVRRAKGVGGGQMLDRAAGEGDCSRQEEEDEKDKSGIYFVGAHLQI